jgi:hypothetical protein
VKSSAVLDTILILTKNVSKLFNNYLSNHEDHKAL